MGSDAYVILGGGLAGASAAEALRGAGFDGRIALIGEEAELPYQRPPLSKEVLREPFVPDDRLLLRSESFYSSNAIEVVPGRTAIAVLPRERRVEFARGPSIAYDKLLICTGGKPRRLNVAGSDLRGVRYLRTWGDGCAIRADLEVRPRVLVIGTGFIGCEVAASARTVGCDVTLVGPSLPMERALGARVAEAYAAYHRGKGVVLKTGVTVAAFHGSGALEEAELSDGTRVACDLAVVGIGIAVSIPCVEGLEVHGGIVTDEFCRTSVDSIYAAGDVAESWRPRYGRHVRLEHFDNAEQQGAAAGRAMYGSTVPYDPVPFFWSDQYDFDLQYYGKAARWDEEVVRGDAAVGRFLVFYRVEKRIEAICLVNRTRDASAAKRLLGRSGVPAAALADESVALKDVG